jgi:ribonuclease Z
MRFEVTILGNTTPFPSKGRLPTSQILNINERLYLVDCGEGVQIRFNELSVKRMKIDHIFISHLHGDHYYGLFGLLGSYRVSRRTTPLHIHCPSGLKELIELEARISHAGPFLFPLHFHETTAQKSKKILDNDDIEVFTIPLKHGEIPTTGFIFKEKEQPRKMIKSKIVEYKIPFQAIPAIKDGGFFKTPEGKIIKNTELTFAPPRPRSYAFCSDTAYHLPIVPIIKGVDLLYHEATFSEADGINASEIGHSTTIEAATIAKKAKAKKLIIGHFSSRHNDLEVLEEEARTVFKNTEVAEEKKTFVVGE